MEHRARFFGHESPSRPHRRSSQPGAAADTLIGPAPTAAGQSALSGLERVITPRPSASVILVRDGSTGPEIFMVLRHARSPAFPSAYVFPGGTVRDDDLAFSVPDAAALARNVGSRADTPLSAPEASAMYVCAVRELFEEAGVFLVQTEQGLLSVAESDTQLQERLASTRLALQAHDLSIGQVLSANAWQPDFERLVPFSHWITPKPLAARFDTRFFVAEMPPGQSALHDTIETSEGVWLTPARALGAEYHTVYATAQHLRRLSVFESTRAMLDFARSKRIRAVLPEMAETPEGVRVFIPPEIGDEW